MSSPGEMPPLNSIETELLDAVSRHRIFETIPDDMMADVVLAVEDTLSYDRNTLLAYARYLDEKDFEAAAGEGSEDALPTKSLMDIYNGHKNNPEGIFRDDPNASEEYAFLTMQHVFARRWFTEMHTQRTCQTQDEVAELKLSDDFNHALALTAELLTRCRPAPRWLPDYLRDIV